MMISSTVTDLLDDRAAIDGALSEIPFVRTVGAKPIDQPPVSGSPYSATVQMAENCHLYILILGGRYGDAQDGMKSPTELEFDAAYLSDPTKVLVLKRRVKRTESRQKDFIERVGDYYSGFWITSYTHENELNSLLHRAFENWIRERAAIGARLSYFDHFVRMSIQRSPAPGAQLSYSSRENHIELEYSMFGVIRSVHIEKSEIIRDFWGSLAGLERKFGEWRAGSDGTRSPN